MTKELYVRCYAFGQKQDYDENVQIKLHDVVVFTYVDKDGKDIEKVTRFPTSGVRRIYPLKGIIKMASKIMKEVYQTYKFADLVEGLEIATIPWESTKATNIHIYRPFSLVPKFELGKTGHSK
jgi:hypothetical protein